MKKLSFLALAVFALSFYSCDVEPVDPAAIANAANNPGVGGNNGGSGSTGDYYPAALNNQWRYRTDGVLNAEPLKMVQVVSSNGLTYYKFNSFNGSTSAGNPANAEFSLRKNSGDYYYKYESVSVNNGQGLIYTNSAYEMLILKDYLSVGQTWTGNFAMTITYSNPMIPTITQDVNYTGKILERDINYTVNGQNYNDVIHIQFTQVYSYLGTVIQTIVNEVWYAKNVGPIKSYYNDQIFENTQTLDSYILN